MAVSTTEPLCQPCVYHEDFKGFCLLPQNLTTPLLSSSSTPQRVDAGSQAVVTPLSEALHRVDVELQVRRPLMPVRLSPEQVGLEMLCLCGQLDLLIRAQMQQFQEQLGQGCSPEESDTFQSEGSEILDQMLQCLEHLPKPMPQLEDYLDMVGLSAMFPRVEVFLIQGSPVDMLDRPLMDEYFFHVAKLNQLLVLSQQLEEDIRHLGSHKYIAHQLSVIYQVISSFRGIQVFSEIKKNIETNFKQMKQSLMAEEGCRHEPQLTAHYISWILEITKGLTSLVLSLPEELTEDLHQAFTFVSQFLS